MSTDALIMLRRNVKHTLRNPVTVFNAVLLPVVIMLMFVYMLGNAFSVGVKYIDYATPGMILLAVAYGLGATATEVNSDMTTGIINRFRVMDVSRGAVLTGHVIVTVLRGLISSQAQPNPMMNVNQVSVNMDFNLAGSNGRQISSAHAHSSSYAGADVSRMALTLVDENADEVVAKLYSDYCTNAGLAAGGKSAPK